MRQRSIIAHALLLCFPQFIGAATNKTTPAGTANPVAAIPALAAPLNPMVAPTLEQLQKFQATMEQIEHRHWFLETNYPGLPGSLTPEAKEQLVGDIHFVADAIKTWPSQPEFQPVINDLELRRKLSRMKRQEKVAIAEASALLADLLNQKEFLDQAHAVAAEEDRVWREKEEEARKVLEEAKKRNEEKRIRQQIAYEKARFQLQSQAVLNAGTIRESSDAMNWLLHFVEMARQKDINGDLVHPNLIGKAPDFLENLRGEWDLNLNIKIRQAAKKSWLRSSPAVKLLAYLPEIKMPEPGGLTLATAESGQVSVSEAGAVALVPVINGDQTGTESRFHSRFKARAASALMAASGAIDKFLKAIPEFFELAMLLSTPFMAFDALRLLLNIISGDFPGAGSILKAIGVGIIVYLAGGIGLAIAGTAMEKIAAKLNPRPDMTKQDAVPAPEAQAPQDSQPAARPRSQETSQ